MNVPTSWTLLQIGAIGSRLELHLVELMGALEPARLANVRGGETVEYSAARIDRIKSRIVEIREHAEQLAFMSETVPDEAIDFDFSEARAGAAADLTAGILEAPRARVAARTLDYRTGFKALAGGLRSGTEHSAWTSCTVDEVLGEFRGATPLEIEAVLRDAGLRLGTLWSDCDPADIARLAAALESHGRGSERSC